MRKLFQASASRPRYTLPNPNLTGCHDVENALDIARSLARAADTRAGQRRGLPVAANHDRGVARGRERHGYNHASLRRQTVRGAKTVAEFVDLAKKTNPPLNYASIGTGSVPYRSTPQSVTDLMGGHVAASFLEAGLSMPLIRDGKLCALAVSSAQKLPLLPDVPPFAEASGAKDYEGVSWHVLLIPAKTPQPIIDRLRAEMKRIMLDPAMREKIAGLGLLPNDTPTVEEMRGFIKSERLKWGAMVKLLGLEGSK
jgi:Tripartite tricarboxylate transporter family receptor